VIGKKKTFQLFLDWFRSEFPYFHDKCDSCGASCKDDPIIPQPKDATTNNAHAESDIVNGSTEPLHDRNDDEPNDETTNAPIINDKHDDDVDDEFSFLGYVYPSPSERLGNASRTELYRCRNCSSFTRFPRYNKALWVTSTKRGRCGEYSMLLYRMLRALGYGGRARWVVDWADHVWAEVWLGGNAGNAGGGGDGRLRHHLGSGGEEGDGGRWVHLDPCEAAVDNPLLYESWGKNQTYIVAFHDPFYSSVDNSRDEADSSVASLASAAVAGMIPSIAGVSLPSAHSSRDLFERERVIREGYHRFPPVEDITHRYTSDEMHVIEKRRGIAGAPVADAIAEVSREMVQLLQRVVRR